MTDSYKRCTEAVGLNTIDSLYTTKKNGTVVLVQTQEGNVSENNVGVIAFAFGTPQSLRSNVRLARWATRFADRSTNGNSFPIFTQHDILIDEDVYDVTYVHGEFRGKAPSTLRIAREAVEWAQERGIDSLWVIAAKPHLDRALRDLQWAARDAGMALSLQVPKSLWQTESRRWFDRTSEQEHTRSFDKWDMHEWLLQLLPPWLYKRFAS